MFLFNYKELTSLIYIKKDFINYKGENKLYIFRNGQNRVWTCA